MRLRPIESLAASRLLACAAVACAACDLSARPTFPREAAHQAIIEEQALLGIDARGDALAAQLIAAEGNPPKLTLNIFDRDGGPTHTLLEATPELTLAIAGRLFDHGSRPEPLLGSAVQALWPEAQARATQEGFAFAAPAPPDPGTRRWQARGVRGLPLLLRIAAPSSGAPAALLVLSEAPGGASDNDEVELTRMPLSGAEVEPLLWLQGDLAWLLAGSTRSSPGEALHRAVGLRAAPLGRGQATLHNQHGLADYAAGELDVARREFDRALEADARFVDALYNAASVAALEDRAEDAVALLRRAAAEDPRRVQVLGRDDEDLKTLRKRPDVRALLGLDRMPPGE